LHKVQVSSHGCKHRLAVLHPVLYSQDVDLAFLVEADSSVLASDSHLQEVGNITNELNVKVVVGTWNASEMFDPRVKVVLV